MKTHSNYFYKIILLMLAILCPVCFSSCATSSTRINTKYQTTKIAVMPLKGAYGEQAADLISEQLAKNGVNVLERAQIETLLKEHNFRTNDMFNEDSLPEYGEMLGVKKILIGTVSDIGGPLYSFKHIKITLKVVDVKTGQIEWIGNYGNSFWTSAISTQGDLQRGSEKIIQELIRTYGKDF